MCEEWKDSFYIRDAHYISLALNIKYILGGDGGVDGGGGGGGG